MSYHLSLFLKSTNERILATHVFGISYSCLNYSLTGFYFTGACRSFGIRHMTWSHTLSSGPWVLLCLSFTPSLSLSFHICLSTDGRASWWASRGSRWLQREDVRVWLWLLLLVRQPWGPQLCIAGRGEHHLMPVYPQTQSCWCSLDELGFRAVEADACQPSNSGTRGRSLPLKASKSKHSENLLHLLRNSVNSVS